MVSTRCKMIVKSELEKLGVQYFYVKLGEAEINEDLTPEQYFTLDNALRDAGLELMNENKLILVEKIKILIIELVHYTDAPIRENLSVYLSEKLSHDYTYMANLFSEVTGITIEKFYLSHKIERVKELLVYDELTLSEIAYKLHYSSLAHLSNQYKKMTGLTPTQFKNLKGQKRDGLGI